MCVEIVVVDSGSTDNTIEIVRKLERQGLPIRLISEPWRGYGAQKQFALDNCTQEWCLSIDSDERVSTKLAAAMPGLISRDVDGWKLTRYDYLPGFGYVPPRLHERFHVRLFRRRLGAFDPTDRVHEGIAGTGQDDDSIVAVLADRMEEIDELLVAMSIENQFFAVGVQADFEHSVRLAAQAGIGKRVTVGVELDHSRSSSVIELAQ